ncbi:MAG: aspartyl/glutamyl-tRNA(Asn/Gln) amidotransferase subunit C [Nitrospirales bacterium]|nr:MAG: aspartyl/glutamyl-tRNA(Asn/Gln) amidotransferase subunit C [Nitrospirales bacterium]
MKISREEVEHIALLARLNIAEGEKELMSEQLSQILTFVNQLGDVDTEGIPLTATTSQQSNVLRDDVHVPSLTDEQATANAPQSEDGFLVVPKIIADRETS